MRIYELAKELEISSKELLDYLNEISYNIRCVSSQIDEKVTMDAKRHFLRLSNKMISPTVYEGDKPYIFISYSHKDDKKVWGIIEKLNKLGYRLWYDKGIDPGTEWADNISEHILKCSMLIAMISKNYIESDNCTDEITFARDKKINRLIIYIEEVALPPAMEMRLSRLQAIYEWRYLDKDDFLSEVSRARNIDACKV